MDTGSPTATSLSAGELEQATPLSAPLYGAPPFYYRGAKSLLISYRTHAAALTPLLPPGLRIVEEFPVISAAISQYPFTTFGPYNECFLAAEVEYVPDDGPPRRGTFVPFIYTTTEPPLAGGRELWGYGKKIGHVSLGQEAEVIWATLNRPAPLRLLSAALKIDRQATVPEFEQLPVFSARVIPSTDPSQEGADLAQLIEAQFPLIPRIGADGVCEVWFGETASITFEAQSAVDPLHRLPVVETLGGYYGTFDAVLSGGIVLHEYS